MMRLSFAAVLDPVVGITRTAVYNTQVWVDPGVDNKTPCFARPFRPPRPWCYVAVGKSVACLAGNRRTRDFSATLP